MERRPRARDVGDWQGRERRFVLEMSSLLVSSKPLWKETKTECSFVEEEGRGGQEVETSGEEQSEERRVRCREEGRNSPSQAGRMCGKQMPHRAASSSCPQQFLSLTFLCFLPE